MIANIDGRRGSFTWEIFQRNMSQALPKDECPLEMIWGGGDKTSLSTQRLNFFSFNEFFLHLNVYTGNISSKLCVGTFREHLGRNIKRVNMTMLTKLRTLKETSYIDQTKTSFKKNPWTYGVFSGVMVSPPI